MKFHFFIIIIAVLFLSACIPKIVTFAGEDENWKVIFEVTNDKIKKEQCAEISGYIRYIGNEPIPEKIEYTINHGFETTDTPTLDDNGIFHFTKGCTYATEGSTVEITIQWEDKVTTIHLNK
ncbi:hypothetical protein [Metasolibacillus sp. FSL K6-0083]|uniref:hypothetical protein n=1 Tax=Metasolibacillus sp. FSL K6-0083 TaxID=2921416 RepID=UPI000797DA11|nr:hypothetical protein A0U40_06880 [[Bacillus] sp. KCTC 13219]